MYDTAALNKTHFQLRKRDDEAGGGRERGGEGAEPSRAKRMEMIGLYFKTESLLSV